MQISLLLFKKHLSSSIFTRMIPHSSENYCDCVNCCVCVENASAFIKKNYLCDKVLRHSYGLSLIHLYTRYEKINEEEETSFDR